MAYSSQTFTGNGVLLTFSVSLNYLAISHLSVYVDDVLQVAGTDYDWSLVSGTDLVFVTEPANGAVIRVVRTTGQEPLLDWEGVQTVSPDALNKTSRHGLYLHQEVSERWPSPELLADLDADNDATLNARVDFSLYHRVWVEFDRLLPEVSGSSKVAQMEVGFNAPGDPIAGSEVEWLLDYVGDGLSGTLTDTSVDAPFDISLAHVTNFEAFNFGFSGQLTFHGAYQIADTPGLYSGRTVMGGSATVAHNQAFGTIKDTDALGRTPTELEFSFSAGNIVSGNMRVYGLRR